MSNPFASIDTTLSSVALAAVNNADLVWGSQRLACLFDAAYQDPSGLVNSRPQARVVSELVETMTAGAAVTLRGVAYTVQAIEPDGAGLSTLVLRRA